MILRSKDMKNYIFTFLFSVSAACQFISAQCTGPSPINPTAESITNVTFGTINNTTTNPFGYNDYTSLSTDVLPGSTHNLSVSIDGNGYTYQIWVWIDWNGDGVFANPSEFYDLGGTTLATSQNITVPAGAIPGNATMRIIAWYDGGYDPPSDDGCGDVYDYGECEDYTVNIISACSPVVTMIKTCDVAASSYSVEVQITDLNGATGVNITDGITTYETNVGVGTYIVSGVTSDATIYVEDIANSTCQYSEVFILCCTEPTVNVTKNCYYTTNTYSLEVEITDLGTAAGVDINDGTTVYETNVGLGTYIIDGFLNNSTIYVIDNAGATCQFFESFTECDICVDEPSLPEDECINAPLIDLAQPFFGSTSCSYTESLGDDDVSCVGTVDNDSWISFIAASESVELEVEVGTCTGTNTGIQLVVFSGSCASLTEIPGSCISPDPVPNSESTFSWEFDNLTVGDTYYVWIDGYAGQLCDYSFTPVDGVATTPDNDECFEAELLTCDNPVISNNILATNTDAPSACSGGGTTAKGVWYSFIGTGYDVVISTDASATNFDTEINVYEGPCNSLNCIGGDDNSGTGVTSEFSFNTVNGQEYFIYVDGNSNSEGQFEISLTCSSCIANPGTWD